MGQELIIPSTRELEALTSKDRWQLEVALDEVQPRLRDLNDAELRVWVEDEGKTQTEIAELVGLAQNTISNRCVRLGIEVSKGKGTQGGRPRKVIGPDNPDPTEPEPELVEGEVVEDGWDDSVSAAAEILSDNVDPEADSNIRTVLVRHLFSAAYEIRALRKDGAVLRPRDKKDRRALIADIDKTVSLLTGIKEEVTDVLEAGLAEAAQR